MNATRKRLLKVKFSQLMFIPKKPLSNRHICSKKAADIYTKAATIMLRESYTPICKPASWYLHWCDQYYDKRIMYCSVHGSQLMFILKQAPLSQRLSHTAACSWCLYQSSQHYAKIIIYPYMQGRQLTFAPKQPLYPSGILYPSMQGNQLMFLPKQPPYAKRIIYTYTQGSIMLRY